MPSLLDEVKGYRICYNASLGKYKIQKQVIDYVTTNKKLGFFSFGRVESVSSTKEELVWKDLEDWEVIFSDQKIFCSLEKAKQVFDDHTKILEQHLEKRKEAGIEYPNEWIQVYPIDPKAKTSGKTGKLF